MSVKKSVIEQFDSKQLEKYLDPKTTYVSEAIGYAFDILKKRGRVFSPDEIQAIDELIANKEKLENERKQAIYHIDKNATNDADAISLYSRNLLWIFGVLFSVAFASVLLAINFHKLNLKKAMVLTLLFGFIFTGLQVVFAEEIIALTNRTGMSSSKSFLLSALGVIGLHYLWTRFIPVDLKYRTRSFIIPLIIALAIFIPVIYILVTS